MYFVSGLITPREPNGDVICCKLYNSIYMIVVAHSHFCCVLCTKRLYNWVIFYANSLRNHAKVVTWHNPHIYWN